LLFYQAVALSAVFVLAKLFYLLTFAQLIP